MQVIQADSIDAWNWREWRDCWNLTLCIRPSGRYIDHFLRTLGSNLRVKKSRKRQVGDDCQGPATTSSPPRFISFLTNLENIKNIFNVVFKFYSKVIITIIRCITTGSSRHHVRNSTPVFQSVDWHTVFKSLGAICPTRR